MNYKIEKWIAVIVCSLVVASPSYSQYKSSQLSINSFDRYHSPRNGKIFVIAHRGVHINIPENTLAAYQKAIDLGCDFVEVDIRRTKDGEYVSIHNSTVDAYTNMHTGNVNSFTLEELKKIDIGSRINQNWSKERIPTFEEILKLCKNRIGIYLDLKEPFAEELIQIVKEFEMEKEIVWYIPFSEKEEMKKLNKNCDKCFLMPDPDLNEINNSVQNYKLSIIAPVMSQFSAEYLERAHQIDVRVFVDEAKGTDEEWEELITLGIDGIQTDNPEKLINYLNGK